MINMAIAKTIIYNLIIGKGRQKFVHGLIL